MANKKIRKEIYAQALEQQAPAGDKETRPTWFAIKEYYEVIQKYMESISTCIIKGDSDDLFRALKGFFYFIQPFINPENAVTTNHLKYLRVNTSPSF